MTQKPSPSVQKKARRSAIDAAGLTRKLIFVIVGGMITALIWAGLTPVDQIRSGTGVIKPQQNTLRVEHPYGGVVIGLDVSLGDEVEEGATLLSLDTASLLRERETLLARQAVLDAEERRVTRVLNSGGAALLTDPPDEISAEEQLFWAEQAFQVARLDILQAEATSIRNRLQSLTARQASLMAELDVIETQRARIQQLADQGSVRINEAEEVSRAKLQVERAILDLESEVSAAEDALLTLDLRRTELLAERVRDAAQRKADLAESRVATRQSLDEIADRLARADIRAEIAGTVQYLSVTGRNEVVAAGDLIAEIVPKNSSIEAEVEISAAEIGAVEPGLLARLKISTYDFTRFGVLSGYVSAVSPTSFQNEVGETVYRVTITLPQDGQGTELAGNPVRPGMTVTADIISGRRTVLSYLLKPLREIRSSAFTEAG